jgi:hypothetical protein
VLVPFTGLTIPDPDFPQNSGQHAREQMQRSFPTLAGESRLTEGNGNGFFHAGAVAPGNRVRPGPPTDGGSTPPPHRPDQPCELQPLPNLHAPGGPTMSFQSSSPTTSSAGRTVSRDQASRFAQAFGRALPGGLKKAQELQYKQTKRSRAKKRGRGARKATTRKVSR